MCQKGERSEEATTRGAERFMIQSDSGLIVSEIFGPTIQGEGPFSGRRAFFLRLGICNLRCTFCDSKFTWDWENLIIKKSLPAYLLKRLQKDLLI